MWGIGEKRIVARTPDEVDLAFSGNAKEIVIEGNDTLIRYAELKAGLPSGPADQEPPPAPEATNPLGHDPDRAIRHDMSSSIEHGPKAAPPMIGGAPPLTAPKAAAAPKSRTILVISALLVAILLGSVIFLIAAPPKTESVIERTAGPPVAVPAPEPQSAGEPQNSRASISTDSSSGTPQPDPSPPTAAPYPSKAAPESAAPSPEAASDTGPAAWMPLVWPIVALVAIVLMFLLARQAIAGGSNVSLEWRITEKVQGKLKVTRVRPPSGG